MDTFEYNKIIASVLVALLIGMVGSLLADYLVHPEKLDNPVLVVEGAPTSVKLDGVATEEEVLKPIAPLLASASIERGKEIAKKCTQCHTFEKGGPSRTGPNLWGIVGAQIAHAANFAYSSGFKEKGGTWDFEKLNELIHKPRTFVKGTKMSFVGLKNDQERADVIAYLNSLSDTPTPLPQPPKQ